MSRLSLSLFGRLRIKLNGDPLTNFRTKKARALLIYLAAAPTSPHPREKLMTLFWPGMLDQSARQNLRQVVYQLRQAIPALAPGDKAESSDAPQTLPLLLANRHTIQLNPLAAIETDVHRFTKLINRPTTHQHVDLRSCHRCRQALESAVSLYNNDFISDFYLDDSNAFEEWAEMKRQTYRRQVLDALETLTTIMTRRQAYAEGRIYAERQIAIDDLGESAYRQLMEILALSGQRQEACALYEDYSRLLAAELGMSPTARTTGIYNKILAGELNFDSRPVPGVRGYELKEEIDKGAHGVIYRAVQPTIDREVAVKIINKRYANDPEFIRRFEAEAQTIARLEHPNIVPLYDYWRESGGAYLVMRWLRAGSLLTSLKSGPWDLEPTLQLVDQITAALALAHRQGVIHRDIKPANILLDEVGNAYLSDFGIAKDLTEDLQLTGDGILGTPDYISPEQLRDEQVTPQTDLYSLGAVLYETLTGEKPFPNVPMALLLQKQLETPVPLICDSRPDLPRQIDTVIQRATAKQPTERYPDALALAVAFHQAVQDAEQAPVDLIPLRISMPVINPYKGLYAFQEADAPDFFGREALVERLVSRLDSAGEAQSGNKGQVLGNGRFLAVVGPSGSGKSSVVKAGLIPALRQDALSGSNKWFVAEMVPGSQPLRELEQALLPIAVEPPPSLLEPLKKDARGLLRTLRRILPKEEGSQLLLVIDQFEELYTLGVDEAQRVHFLDSLVAAITAPRSPLLLVVTLRADFYDRPLQYQPIGELFRHHTELVLPLSQESLIWAIKEPARRVGVAVEAELVTAVVSDVIDQPGALPLMQFALMELFEQRHERMMTLAAYKTIGGVSGALAQRAEELYIVLSDAGKTAVRQLFLRLVTLGEGASELGPVTDTRRRVLRSELEALSVVGEQEEVDYGLLIGEFSRFRLLTFDRDPISRAPTVEVAHEALLHEWRRLRDWLADSRVDVRLQRRLAIATQEWLHAGKDTGFLLRGTPLTQFESWITDTNLALTPDEQSYLASSSAAREARLVGEEARRQNELETARHLAETERKRAEEQASAAQTLRHRAVYLGVALGVALILALTAVVFSRQATQNANLAAARELATSALLSLESDPERSILLSIHSLGMARSPEGVESLRESLLTSRLRHTWAIHDELVRDVVYSPDGRYLITSGKDESGWAMTMLEVGSGEVILTVPVNEVRCISFLCIEIAMSPNGQLLAMTGEDNDIFLLDFPATSASKTVQIVHRLDGHDELIQGMSFNATGTWLATAGWDHMVRVWDTVSGEPLYAVEMPLDDCCTTPFFSADDAYLVVPSPTPGEPLHLFDGATGELLMTFPVSLGRGVFSPDGKRLIAGQLGQGVRESLIYIWDIEASLAASSPQEIFRFSYGSGTSGSEYWNLTLSPSGTFLGIPQKAGRAEIWELGEDHAELVATLSGHTASLNSLTFSPDETLVVTAGNDGTVRVWDISPAGHSEYLALDAHRFLAKAAVYSADGDYLATAGFDGEAAIWDAETGELVQRFIGHSDNIMDVAISPDGLRLITAGRDNVAIVWDTQTGAEIARLEGHHEIPAGVNDFFAGVLSATFSPDGQWIATGGADSTLKLWDATNYRLIRSLSVHPEELMVTGVRFSPDNTKLASITLGSFGNIEDALIKVWDVATYEPLQEWFVSNRPLHSLSFGPDSTLLAVSGNNGVVGIWDVKSGAERRLWEHPQISIAGISFNPDGTQLATASSDGLVRIWNSSTGELLETFTGHQGFFLSDVTFSPDGKQLAAGAGDGVVRVYLLEMEDLVTLAQSRVTRSLTTAECQQYMHLDSCPVQ